jgi:hypothetical protein
MGRLLTTLIGMLILHIVAYPLHPHTFRLHDPIFPKKKYLRHTVLWVGEAAKGAGWLCLPEGPAEFDDNNTQSCTY